MTPLWIFQATMVRIAERAFVAGYLYALALAAERIDDLDAVCAMPRLDHETRVAERVAEMEWCAEHLPRSTWRGRYRGGPVVWESAPSVGVAA